MIIPMLKFRDYQKPLIAEYHVKTCTFISCCKKIIQDSFILLHLVDMIHQAVALSGVSLV